MDKRIKFYYNDKQVIAVGRFGGSEYRASAKCAPDSEFSLSVGENLAAARCKAKMKKAKLATARKEFAQASADLAAAKRKYMKALEYVVKAEHQYETATEDLLELETDIMSSSC